MRSIHDDSQANLIDLLAHEHRTVEGLVDELAFLDTDDVDQQCELFVTLQSYAAMSKASLIEAIRRA